MLRRWLIQIPFFLPLTIVVAVWIVSAFGEFVWGKMASGREWYTGAIRGLYYLGENYYPHDRDRPLEFVCHWGIKQEDTGLPRTTLGFGYHCGIDFLHRDSLVIVFPLWLPTLLLTGLNWLVWRKTRPGKPGGAFPVEMSAHAYPSQG